MRTLGRRGRFAAAALLLLPFVAASQVPIARASQTTDAVVVRAACSLPPEELLRIWRGTRLDRSATLQIVPQQPNFVSAGFSHAGPWDYLQRVPLFFYGPGTIRPGVYPEPVTEADIAPTEARILHFGGFRPPDGKPLTDSLVPGAPAPKLLVTVVWDAAGWDVLRSWPKDWPNLKAMFAKGALFTGSTSGSSPSDTPPIHASIGTGAYPRRTGVMDQYQSDGGRIVKPEGPSYLLEPTLADLYDRAMGNRPVVGMVATLAAHAGMLGHGAMWGGGDRDIAVTREIPEAQTSGVEALHWNLVPAMRPYFRLPSYVNQVPGFKRDIAELDRSDGAQDGMWLDNSIEQLQAGFYTPARTPYQTSIVEAIVRREGFGADATPDLLFINYKAIDTIGHLFSINSPEMKSTLSVQDQSLPVLVNFLDRQVGKGQWVMALTADHGHQFNPSVSGAFEIDITAIEKAIDEAFPTADGVPVVERVRPTEIWLNTAELAKSGHTPADVARYVMSLTEQQTLKKGETIEPGHSGQRVFAAAFPSSILGRLPCLPVKGTG